METGIAVLAFVTATAIFIFDLSLPLGVAAGVPYVALVLLGVWMPGRKYVIALAVLATVLTLLGLVLSSEGGIKWMVYMNRFLALFAIWVTAVLLLLIKSAQRKLVLARDELQQYVNIVDQHVITSTTDRLGTIVSASEAFCRVSGYSKDELIGQSHNIVRHPDMPRSLYREMWERILAGDAWDGEIKNRKKDGSYYWVKAHIVPLKDGTGYTAVREDITDKKRVEQLSVTDTLTQLNNRMKLDDEMRKEVVRAERYGDTFALLLMDIDYFKSVNDSYGHQVGDQVLRDTAGIIRKVVRESDIAGRWGGEEFLIICPKTTAACAAGLAERLREAIATHSFAPVGTTTGSFGVVAYQPGEGEGGVIKRVDDALYQAKAQGRNRVVVMESAVSGEVESV